MAQSAQVDKSTEVKQSPLDESASTAHQTGVHWSGIASGLAVQDGQSRVDHQHDHQRPAALDALRRQAGRAKGGAIRRMKVDGKDVDAAVSGTTRKKHVAPTGEQQAKATAEFGSMTFVTSDQILIDAVKLNGLDFPAGQARSDREDVEIEVPIYQWEKVNPPPAGMAKGQPSSKTIDGVKTKCEVGVEKTGAGALSITHFKKL